MRGGPIFLDGVRRRLVPVRRDAGRAGIVGHRSLENESPEDTVGNYELAFNGTCKRKSSYACVVQLNQQIRSTIYIQLRTNERETIAARGSERCIKTTRAPLELEASKRLLHYSTKRPTISTRMFTYM